MFGASEPGLGGGGGIGGRRASYLLLPPTRPSIYFRYCLTTTIRLGSPVLMRGPCKAPLLPLLLKRRFFLTAYGVVFFLCAIARMSVTYVRRREPSPVPETALLLSPNLL